MSRLALMQCYFSVVLAVGVVSSCDADMGITGAGPSGVCRSSGGSGDGALLPGKYWEEQGSNRLDKEDAIGALEAFKIAAYYGNRDALYDVAMMYMKGAKKIQIDVPLGVAWLQLAKQYDQSLATDALVKLEPELTSDQRDASFRDFQNLVNKYGVSVTRPRVMKTFQLGRGHAAFANWICYDGLVMASDIYLQHADQDFADYVTTMFGRVTVEPLQPVAAPAPQK
jgi:TPR repeat protein